MEIKNLDKEVQEYFDNQKRNKLFCFLDNRKLVKKYGLFEMNNFINKYVVDNNIILLTRDKNYCIAEPFDYVEIKHYCFFD